MKYKYTHAALGGTFDLLHKGHQTFLQTSFAKSRFISIGITSDKMNKSIEKITIEDQQNRFKNVKDFLKKKNLGQRAKITFINDIYGTTLIDQTIQALVVTRSTLNGATLLNQKRIQIGLSKLPLIICPQLYAKDNKHLSSTRIRNGEIDRSGRSYKHSLCKIAGSKLSLKTRKKLKKPLGIITKMVKNLNNSNPLIAVGDFTVSKLLESRIIPKLSIVDFHTQRTKIYDNLTQLGFNQNYSKRSVINYPGEISQELIFAVERGIKSSLACHIILVKGEEDLATIPSIMLSPLGTTVCYGQPQQGTVIAKVSENLKQYLSGTISL